MDHSCATSSNLTNMTIEPRPILAEMSLVIPTLGRELLMDCLTAIAGGTHWPRELIVVDQGDNDRVTRWLEPLESAGLRVRHLKQREKSIPQALNRGIREAPTTYVAITHDDCQVFPDWLSAMSLALSQFSDAIVTGRVEPGKGGEGESMLMINTSRIPQVYTRPPFKKVILFPNNMGFARLLYQRIGGFDEHPLFQRAGEDADWQYRALRLGVAINFVPEVAVTHRDWRDREKRLATYQTYARGQGAFYAKHAGRGDLVVFIRMVSHLLWAPLLWGWGWVFHRPEMAIKGKAFTLKLLPGIIAGFNALRRNEFKC